MTNYLKPCPFCGEKAEHPETMIEGCVSCSNPNCVAWTFPSDIKAWNTRPIEDAQAQMIISLEGIRQCLEAINKKQNIRIAKLELKIIPVKHMDEVLGIALSEKATTAPPKPRNRGDDAGEE